MRCQNILLIKLTDQYLIYKRTPTKWKISTVHILPRPPKSANFWWIWCQSKLWRGLVPKMSTSKFPFWHLKSTNYKYLQYNLNLLEYFFGNLKNWPLNKWGKNSPVTFFPILSRHYGKLNSSKIFSYGLSWCPPSQLYVLACWSYKDDFTKSYKTLHMAIFTKF